MATSLVPPPAFLPLFVRIGAVDLSHVIGGVDKQTAQAQTAITAATSAMEDLARDTKPKDNSMTEMLMQVMSNRRQGSGPSSAPALPPTSTLTR